MLEQISYFSAFLVGFLGVVHCAGMCGGIVGALTLGQTSVTSNKRLAILFAYNVGRIFSYCIAGALMGGIGWLASSWLDIHYAQGLLQLVAAIFMMALGLYLAGWWYGLNKVEQAGSVVWKRLEPIGRRLLPVTGVNQAFVLGMVWGWLPCGLVYSVLIWSISAGSFTQGGLLMLSFGLGTLPNLLAMGLFADVLRQYIQTPIMRKIAGVLVMGFAVYLFVLAVGVVRQAG